MDRRLHREIDSNERISVMSFFNPHNVVAAMMLATAGLMLLKSIRAS
jgi:hypothetical protein